MKIDKDLNVLQFLVTDAFKAFEMHRCKSYRSVIIVLFCSGFLWHMYNTHPSGRNVMLDLCLTVLMGETGHLCVGDRAGSARLVHFYRQHICCTDVIGERNFFPYQCSGHGPF